jgi:uncharacterized membrane protein
MGKKAKARRESTARPLAVVDHPVRSGVNNPLLALSTLGALLAGYMAWTALGGGLVRGCSAGSACDVVLSSDWATTLGFPTAFWGFLTYVALAAIAFVKRADRHWQYAWTLSFFGLAYSLYLTTVSVTILDAACPYCLTSLGLMTAIFIVVTLQRPKEIASFAWPGWLAKIVPASLAVILLLHLGYTGVIGTPVAPDDPIARALADHLTQTGAKMYGAYWCPHCQDQKRVFGSAAKYLPYIECSPNGQGTAPAPVCLEQDIKSYPTWVVKGSKREAVMSLRELADASGFKAPPAPESSSN